MKSFTKEVQIALVAIVGIVVLFFGLQFLKGLSLFSSDNNYYVKFKDISGLSASSPVYANGYRVGVVENIIFDYEHQDDIVAVIGLDKQLHLPRGTRAEIASDLLGNVKLELRMGDNVADLLAKGDTIQGGAQEGLMGKAGDMLPQLERMLPKLDSILASVNALLADPALSSNDGTLGLLMRDQDLYRNMAATMGDVDSLMIDLKQHPKRYVHFSIFGKKDK